MSAYLLVAATSLWIDQLINGTLVNISTHNTAYLVSFTILNVVRVVLERSELSPYIKPVLGSYPLDYDGVSSWMSVSSCSINIEI